MKARTGESGFFAAKALLKAFSTKKGVPKFLVDPKVTPHYDPNTHTVVCQGVPRGEMSPEALVNFRAALDHELSESQVTTWPFELRRRYPKGGQPKGLGLLCNGIGDVKVDAWIGSQYPGTELNIYKAIRIDVVAFSKAQQQEPMDPSNSQNRVLMAAMACRYVGDKATTIDELKARLPHLAPLLEAIRHEVEHLEWDGTVGALVDQAERLHTICMDGVECGPEPKRPGRKGGQGGTEGEGEGAGSTEGDEDGTGGEGTSTGSGDNEEDSDETSDPLGSDDSKDDSETDDGEAEGDEGTGEDSESQADADTEVEADIEWDIQQKLLDRFNDELSDPKGSNYIVNDSKDEILEESKVSVNGTAYLDQLEQLDCYKEYAKYGGALAIRIKQALFTATRKFRLNREKGSIDPRAIHKIAAALPNGFRRKLHTEANDTVIMLGIDASSSMWGGRSELARDLSFIWNDACRRLKVPIAIYDWATNGRIGMQAYDEVTGKMLYSRASGLLIRVLKDFESSYTHRSVLNRMASIGGSGSTPTGEGLAFGCERIAARPERKKILFFITDGCPDYGNGHHRYIVDVMEEAKRRGVLVIVLGMDAFDVHGLFGTAWHQVPTASDFIRVTTASLVKVIRNWRP